MYSPNDLVKLIQSSAWIPDALRQSLKGSIFENLLLAGLRELSPVYWVSKESPPFLLIHGTADTLVPFDQSQELCDKLRAAGVRCEIYPVNGGHHGLRWWEAEGRTDYKEQMVHWLEHELR
jgi:dipeptidyl aminopeptidase/acylaminoacyl peptidase